LTIEARGIPARTAQDVCSKCGEDEAGADNPASTDNRSLPPPNAESRRRFLRRSCALEVEMSSEQPQASPFVIPLAELERALIDAYITAQGYDPRQLHLAADERHRLVKAGS
jgi:hypothetical protein